VSLTTIVTLYQNSIPLSNACKEDKNIKMDHVDTSFAQKNQNIANKLQSTLITTS